MTASCPKILKALMVVGGGTGEFILFKNHLSLHLISSFGGLRNCHPGNNLHVFLFPFRMSRVCLTLLSAMVAQGPDTARDVFSHFDFNNKFLPALVKKRDKKVS